MSDHEAAGGGLSRRDVIRRGAVAGGTLLWATPVIQSLGGVAHAQGSPGPGGECVYYAIHLDADGGCNDVAGSSSPGSTDCVSGGASHFGEAVAGGCDFFDSAVRTDDTWTVYLKPVVEASSVQGFSKCGESGCEPAVATDGTSRDTVVFFECPSGPKGQDQDISNVQIVFCVPDEN
jgi:hypothetical protein